MTSTLNVYIIVYSQSHMSNRNIEKIISEICIDRSYNRHIYADGWIQIIEGNEGKKMSIYGYRFSCNDSASDRICSDKAGLYELLNNNSIRAVPHIYFGKNETCYDTKQISKSISNMLTSTNSIICKPNNGTGGSGIVMTYTVQDTITEIANIWDRNKHACISPRRNIESEYRVIVYKDKVMIVYEKCLPCVYGDGIRNVRELASEKGIHSDLLDYGIDSNYIPKKRETIVIGWKHNLKYGAFPRIVRDNYTLNILGSLALHATAVIGINFASVDIVNDEYGFEILEVNSGVMMERFSLSNPDNYSITKDVYQEVIDDNLSKR